MLEIVKVEHLEIEALRAGCCLIEPVMPGSPRAKR